MTRLLSYLFGGFGKQPAAPEPASCGSPRLKVAVFADGGLTVDGAASTVEALRQSLWSLSEQQGAVWYYREAAEQEPPPIAMEVMQAVVDARLPIRLSSRPDFSDSIGPDGKPAGQ